jgi:hypothetical protein
MSDLTINSREDWNARPPRCDMDRRPWSEVHELYIHWPGAIPETYRHLDSRSEAIAQLRSWQQFHQVGRGWCDIGYNYACFQPRGSLDMGDSLWVARGGGYTPAAQLGHNQGTVAIVVAIGPDDELLEDTKSRLRSFVRWIKAQTREDLPVRGHQQAPGASTECPGFKLMAYMDDLNHV